MSKSRLGAVMSTLQGKMKHPEWFLQTESFFLETLWIPIQNCVLGSLLLIILGALGLLFGSRLVSVKRCNLHWYGL